MAITLPAGKAAVRSQIDTQFGPVNPSLQPAEITALNDARDKLAFSIAEEGVYVQGAAVVNTNDTGTVTSGGGAGGSVVATGVGTLT